MKEVRNYRKLKSSLDEMYLWDDDKKIQHIRELHRHIEDLYDEVDKLNLENDRLKDEINLDESGFNDYENKIQKLVEANLDLGGQVLKLKAELYDLLR